MEIFILFLLTGPITSDPSKMILAAFDNEHYYKNLNGNIQHKERTMS